MRITIHIIKISLLITTLTTLNACDKEEIDSRDQYVGTWNYEQSGNYTFFQNGQGIGTIPTEENGVMVISKSGGNSLIIGEQKYIVNGSTLSSEPENITGTDNEVNFVGTTTNSGSLCINTITINSSTSGTWTSTNNATGTLSGSTTTILSK